MSNILRTYGTGNCLLCGNQLTFDAQRYCTSCRMTRSSMIAKLENDEDLLRIFIICTRHGASVPYKLFLGGKGIGAAIQIRLRPLQDFLLAGVAAQKLALNVYGVLWVDISEDVTSVYRATPRLTDLVKVGRYNDSARLKIAAAVHQHLPIIGLLEFRKQRDLGFDYLFPKGQDHA